MKKIIALLLLCALLLSCALLSSCDQDEVDAKREEIMDKAKDTLGPFFEEASESSVDDSDEDVDEEQK